LASIAIFKIQIYITTLKSICERRVFFALKASKSKNQPCGIVRITFRETQKQISIPMAVVLTTIKLAVKRTK